MDEMQGAVLNHQLARFKVPSHLIHRAAKEVHRLLQGVLVLEASYDYPSACFHYLAYGPAFTPLGETMEAPWVTVREVGFPRGWLEFAE